MGLNVPEDLDAWRRWQARRRGVQSLRSRLARAGSAQPALSLMVRGSSPRVLLALDSRSPSGIASLQRLVDRIHGLAVVSSVHTADELSTILASDELRGSTLGELASIRAVVAAGHYLPAGSAAWSFAMKRGIENIVVQHGLMTPFAPPLPAKAHLLSFSEADGVFWSSGRSDVTWTATGSQLLWSATRNPATRIATSTPYYLGQLHGAELPRLGMTRAIARFWHETGATYRPHPSERDRLSLLQHQLWERRGMIIDRERRGLTELDGPVVAAFSTGLVEAAASGLPSWSYYPNAPRWVQDFWDRYQISRWDVDSQPTPAPALPEIEPAEAIADAVLAIAGGSR
ncbi:RNA-binding protein [Microbacterium sp. SD291]|uniref:RNA-binding protein n=1 Tax=Microbacterium sp. SD291 TaxID=2782007 RepID=UPI001A97357E|nr:RNA-binding protein [Microbacterium sp. SD291]MBO0981013.1 RNA-binding protein [Microbacterium sp. SD291]